MPEHPEMNQSPSRVEPSSMNQITDLNHPTSLPPLPELVESCRRGDQRAAKMLYDRYVGLLLAQAKRRLSQRLASRVEAEDIVQSVFRSFFLRLQKGEYQFDQGEDIAKLLLRITVNKTLRQVTYHQAAKRALQQETPQPTEANEALIQVAGRDPSPEEAVAYVDEVEHFLKQLPTEARRIIELRLEGFSEREIAERLQISDRKVRRINERIRELAERDGSLFNDKA